MPIKVAINGYGRIGRNILKALFEFNRHNQIDIVAINDLGTDLNVHAHLTKFDSVHGMFNADVSQDGEQHLIINNHKIRFFHERNPELLPWKDLNIDVVLECTGVFTSKNKAMAHINAGTKKVLISAPGGNDVDATIVYGVNHHIINKDMQVLSNASCTTNCLAPLAMILDENFGIESGLMTTIHSYTNDQVLTDVYHSDVRRARSATISMIPTKTGAASAVGLVLPQLRGKLDGLAIRVPTPNVSLVDLSFVAKHTVTKESVNIALINASKDRLKGILTIANDNSVSIDFNHNSASSIFDPSQTKVIDNLVKVFSWYDNEWGFSCRMLDTALIMMD